MKKTSQHILSVLMILLLISVQIAHTIHAPVPQPSAGELRIVKLCGMDCCCMDSCKCGETPKSCCMDQSSCALSGRTAGNSGMSFLTSGLTSLEEGAESLAMLFDRYQEPSPGFHTPIYHPPKASV